jgi:hypothetical protein
VLPWRALDSEWIPTIADGQTINAQHRVCTRMSKVIKFSFLVEACGGVMNQGNNNNGKMVLFVYCLCFFLFVSFFFPAAFFPPKTVP